MKTILFPLLLLGACAALPLHAADSKRTAEYVLANNASLEGKEVTLDVAFVKPVHWKSPTPELAFFRAVTIDRSDRKPGGFILVAVEAKDTAAFTRRYGMDFQGKADSDQLRGTLLAAPTHKSNRPGLWIVDTTGKVADLIVKEQLIIPEVASERDGGEGMKPGKE